MRCGWGGRGVSMLLGRCRYRSSGDGRTGYLPRKLGCGVRWEETDTVATYGMVNGVREQCS